MKRKGKNHSESAHSDPDEPTPLKCIPHNLPKCPSDTIAESFGETEHQAQSIRLQKLRDQNPVDNKLRRKVGEQLEMCGFWGVMIKQACGDIIGIRSVHTRRELWAVEILPKSDNLLAFVADDLSRCERVLVLVRTMDDKVSVQNLIGSNLGVDALERALVITLDVFFSREQ